VYTTLFGDSLGQLRNVDKNFVNSNFAQMMTTLPLFFSMLMGAMISLLHVVI
jgi:hypothetical protein